MAQIELHMARGLTVALLLVFGLSLPAMAVALWWVGKEI